MWIYGNFPILLLLLLLVMQFLILTSLKIMRRLAYTQNVGDYYQTVTETSELSSVFTTGRWIMIWFWILPLPTLMWPPLLELHLRSIKKIRMTIIGIAMLMNLMTKVNGKCFSSLLQREVG